MTELIKRLFFTFVSKRRILFDLLDEYEDWVRDEDVSKRNTLLGSVRSVGQYSVNINCNFYHVPANSVDAPEEVKYVALYRSKNLFADDNPGVTHYGRVTSFVKVKRFEIKELPRSSSSCDDYYRFNVDCWHTLEKPIKARDSAPNVCLKTSFYLLNNSKFVYELYVENNNEFKLLLALWDTVNKVHDGFFAEEARVFTAFSRIIVLTPKYCYLFKIKSFKRQPLKTLTTINSIMFNRE